MVFAGIFVIGESCVVPDFFGFIKCELVVKRAFPCVADVGCLRSAPRGQRRVKISLGQARSTMQARNGEMRISPAAAGRCNKLSEKRAPREWRRV